MEEFEERFLKISSYGTALRASTLPLLFQVLEVRIKLFHLSHPTLDYLEREYRQFYDRYVNWEHDIESFLGDITAVRSQNQLWNRQAEKQSTRINTQRDDLRTLLHQIGLVLNNHRAQTVNHTAIQIAFAAFLASIILGLISIYVAYTSAPIILYPPKY